MFLYLHPLMAQGEVQWVSSVWCRGFSPRSKSIQGNNDSKFKYRGTFPPLTLLDTAEPFPFIVKKMPTQCSHAAHSPSLGYVIASPYSYQTKTAATETTHRPHLCELHRVSMHLLQVHITLISLLFNFTVVHLCWEPSPTPRDAQKPRGRRMSRIV